MDIKPIFQANEITKGRYNFSSTAKDAFLMVLRQLKKDDKPNAIYNISIRGWRDDKGKELRFDRVDKALDELRNTDIVVVKENGHLLKSKFVSSVEYLRGTGIAEISIDPKIREYYFDLKSNFTTYQFKMALSLNSFYSKRIYELLSMDKRKSELVIEIDELRDMFELNKINSKGKVKFERFSDFKKFVLEGPKKELSEHTDISFDYEALMLYSGKAKSHIRFFNIKHEKPYQVKMEFTDDELDVYNRLQNEFKLSKKQADQVISTEKVVDIRKGFHYIKTNYDSAKGSIGGFTAKHFGVQF
jgi:plasmid replication initiation protein